MVINRDMDGNVGYPRLKLNRRLLKDKPSSAWNVVPRNKANDPVKSKSFFERRYLANKNINVPVTSQLKQLLGMCSLFS